MSMFVTPYGEEEKKEIKHIKRVETISKRNRYTAPSSGIDYPISGDTNTFCNKSMTLNSSTTTGTICYFKAYDIDNANVESLPNTFVITTDAPSLLYFPNNWFEIYPEFSWTFSPTYGSGSALYTNDHASAYADRLCILADGEEYFDGKLVDYDSYPSLTGQQGNFLDQAYQYIVTGTFNDSTYAESVYSKQIRYDFNALQGRGSVSSMRLCSNTHHRVKTYGGIEKGGGAAKNFPAIENSILPNPVYFTEKCVISLGFGIDLKLPTGYTKAGSAGSYVTANSYTVTMDEIEFNLTNLTLVKLT